MPDEYLIRKPSNNTSLVVEALLLASYIPGPGERGYGIPPVFLLCYTVALLPYDNYGLWYLLVRQVPHVRGECLRTHVVPSEIL